jgi:cytochrome c oxidase accessory protein FixG
MVISKHQTGKIRNLRNLSYSILVPFYFGLPWLRWDGHPLIRLDIPERKFYLLGQVFIPMEGFYLWLFLIGMGLSLFFFTSLIGRVWCGYACPQTVFTDLFDWIGRAISGSKYGKKDNPLFKKALIHILWIGFSVLGSLAWVSYFADPYQMISDIQSRSIFGGEIYWPYFVLFFTGTLYGDMAFVREQFCKYACPYARFQTVLMDDQSMNVTYDYVRGEPRRKGKEKLGDCIACNLCVVVCPTGIDIRDGVQVGCIACGKCVDACTSIMAKENKESLIRYMAQNQVENRSAKIKWIRPRTIAYALLLTIVLSSAIYQLSNRVPIYLSILPDRNIQPMIIPGNRVRNFYEVKLQNISLRDQNLDWEIESDFQAPLNLLIGSDPNQGTVLPKNSSTSLRIILESSEIFPEDLEKRNHTVLIRVIDKNKPNYIQEKQLPFVIPKDWEEL